uniref:Uncharacterized protein n=1 Tax=Daphnia magna TaxID=35525 RepID=A0A0P6JQ35_9CRUS
MPANLERNGRRSGIQFRMPRVNIAGIYGHNLIMIYSRASSLLSKEFKFKGYNECGMNTRYAKLLLTMFT